MHYEILIRTQYDEKDYRSVHEICIYDSDGEEQIDEELTNACCDITTCADQGQDGWDWIKDQVASRLDSRGVKYGTLVIE